LVEQPLPLLLLLAACGASAPAEEPPGPIPPEPPLPVPTTTLTVAPDLSVGGRPCPGTPPWSSGGVAVLCIDAKQMGFHEAASLITSFEADFVVALQPDPALDWALWFLGADLTLTRAEAPLRSEPDGTLRLGVHAPLVIERAPGWSRVGGTWLRDNLPLGTMMMLLPKQGEASQRERTFQLPSHEMVHKLALEVAAPEGLRLNGAPLEVGPLIHTQTGYSLYNPPLATLRTGENTLSSPGDVGLSAHIGETIALAWRSHTAAAEGWAELRFNDSDWDDGDGGRWRRAALAAPEGLGAQIALDGPGTAYVNGVAVLSVDAGGWGQVPDTVWAPGDNLLAVEAPPGVSAALWRY